MANLINRITNANIYVNGVNFLGRAEEVELPQPKLKMAEHKALGLFAEIELPTVLQKMTAKIKWASLYPEVLAVAFLPFTPSQVMVRANMLQFNSAGLQAQVPVVAMMTALFDEMPGFKVIKGENSESPSSLTVWRYTLTIAGVQQLMIDAFANVYQVQGVDQLAQYRANQGG
ncbi:MAG TPA: phage major tail tube protein [Candidatus Binataceae bacterium]|nr:phage major tail tube protein [Candidatus Binataceae bacterium]